MKKFLNIAILPLFTLAVSLVGMLLSFLFYSDANAELLNHRHPAGTALLILSGVVLTVLFLATRKLPTEGKLEEMLPASAWRGIGCFIGTVGIAYCCIQNAKFTDFLTIIALISGILGGVCLLFVGTQRMFRLPPHYVFYGVLTVFFMFLGLVRCRQWGAETQVFWFFFSLLAQVFLLLTVFQYTSVCATGKSPKLLILFSHAAIFFSAVAFPARLDPFYLTSALWLALDGCFFRISEKE